MSFAISPTPVVEPGAQQSPGLLIQIINDAHLSAQRGKRAELKDRTFAKAINYFNELSKSSQEVPVLVLNGDIIEFLNTTLWHQNGIKPFSATPNRLAKISDQILGAVIQNNKLAFDALKNLGSKILIIFVEGNHDHPLFQLPGLQSKLAKLLGRKLNEKIFFVNELNLGKVLSVHHGYQADNFHIGAAEDMSQAFTVDLYGSLPTRLTEEMNSKNIPAGLQVQVQEVFDRIESVYPRFLVANWVENQTDLLVSRIPDPNLKRDCRKAIYQAWNRGWDELMQEEPIRNYFAKHPLKSWLTFKLGYNYLGGFLPRLIRKTGALISRFTPMEPGSEAAERYLYQVAQSTGAKVIEEGHYHGKVIFKDVIGRAGVQKLVKATFVPPPIAPFQTEAHSRLQEYLASFDPFSIVQISIPRGLTEPKVRIVQFDESNQSGAPVVSPHVIRSDKDWFT